MTETPREQSAPEILRVEDLTVHFKPSGRQRRRGPIRAVDGVSLAVPEGHAVGIIGESGCGKSTTGRAIVHLTEPTAGRVLFRDEDVTHPTRRRRHQLRRELQFIFQDPQSSLNPRMTVVEILAEPLRAFHLWNRSDGPARAAALLDQVGLPGTALKRYPHEFSGGQRQRLGIARALALEPSLIILDEPVSALDVSVQAQVLNLLMDLRADSDLSFVMISHDLDVIRHVTDQVTVMYLGVIVETGPVADVLGAPAHPYTAALASATPPASPFEQQERLVLRGDLPSAAAPPSGCRFRTRCWRADQRCANEVPLLSPLTVGRQVACHYPREIDTPKPIERSTG